MLPGTPTTSRSSSRIEFDREDVINLDGEGLRAKSVSMKLLPKAMNLIVPKGLGHGTELPPLTL